jgi:autotransporter-associated beta strand protein
MGVARLVVALCVVVLGLCHRAMAQRALGLDVSAHQGEITEGQWDSIYSADNRDFVFIRSSRGGTTGEDHRQGGYLPGDSFFSLSQRYDDPYFIQNISRATSAGLMAGAYHFGRLDVVASTPNSAGIANSGADEATHFVQMAGAYMRPGYLMPTFDLEAGQSERTANEIAQFSLDFSNTVYALTGIRPAIYINGNYSSVLQSASFTLRDQLALPQGPQPSVVSPGYSMLWNARWPASPDAQNDNPRDTASSFYGPWDDYGDFNPWDFWQYTSSGSVAGISPVDLNVSHGDIEYVKDFLVPAVWMNDSSGDWATLANWNSGQPVVAPVSSPGQLAPIGTGALPTPRLPGEAGTGPAVTSGVNDTVILERAGADITVTHSSGTHDVRKLYVREALNITGGTLTVNYDPEYTVPTDEFGIPLYPNALRSGPISAQFSAPVTLSGGAFSVNTLQVDPDQTFTIAGGAISFRRINLESGFPAARLLLSTDLTVDPAAVGGTAYIANSYSFYYGNRGEIDLGGVNRTISVAAGGELVVDTDVVNGALTKSGPGTLTLNNYTNYAGETHVSGGTLKVNGSTGFGPLTVAGAGARVAGTGFIQGDATINSGGTMAPGDSHGALYVAADLSFNAGSTYEYEFDQANFSFDSLNVAGNLNLLGSPTLDLVPTLNGTLPRGTRYALISYGAAWNGGLFDGRANNSLVNLGGNVFRIQYDDNSFDTQNSAWFSNAVTLTTVSGPVSGFRDEYDPANWIIDDDEAHGGSVYTDYAPYQVTLYGPEDRSRLPGEVGYSIVIPASGMLSFDWYFSNFDLPGYDFAYFINGVEASLAGADGEFGHVEVNVLAGDVLGWRITSADSVGGQAILTISNFLAPGSVVGVPEPAAAAASTLAATLLLLKRHRRGDEID